MAHPSYIDAHKRGDSMTKPFPLTTTRQTDPDRLLDHDTAATLARMVRYIRDDTKIARYLGCTLQHVERARSKIRIGRFEPGGAQSYKPLRRTGRNDVEELHASFDDWAVKARRGTDRLAQAIAKASR